MASGRLETTSLSCLNLAFYFDSWQSFYVTMFVGPRRIAFLFFLLLAAIHCHAS